MGDQQVLPTWYTGNAAEDGSLNRGWLLGHFMDPSDGVRSTRDVEVKWGVHPAGEQRAAWTAEDQRTTLVRLVSGRSTSNSPRAPSPCNGRRLHGLGTWH